RRRETRPTARTPPDGGNLAIGENHNRRQGHAGGSGGASPRTSTAGASEVDRRSTRRHRRLVGEGGFEPSRPFGHTDLNRARLPFRHPPWATSRLARPRALPRPGYDRGQGTRREVARWEFCSASSVVSKAW